MVKPRYENGYQAVIALLREHPEWKGVVKAALQEAQSIKAGRFAGAWVLERARKFGISWIPNLRKLVAYGILVKVGDSTRGGRRAYYSMPDIEGVERALSENESEGDQIPYPAHDVTGTGIARKEKVTVPFFANLASCGSPNFSEAHIDDFIEVDARFIKPGHKYFVVRASGNSMELAGINDGDRVLVRSQDHANLGDRVVACLSDGSTIKELQHSGSYYVLVPRSNNKEHKPIVLREAAAIQGIVVGTLSDPNTH